VRDYTPLLVTLAVIALACVLAVPVLMVLGWAVRVLLS
jgi:hypothetical protein